MFCEAVQRWFDASFAMPSDIQRRGWPVIDAGQHVLLVAPTGSGKTLAAFLTAINQLANLPLDAPAGVRILYVSPLKALVADIEHNLRAPLAGIQREAQVLGETVREIRVDVRTGDTSPEQRRAQAKSPADILVTTPESLFLLLSSKARETLRTVTTVIVDEVHSLAPVKRGTHLALSLERLCDLSDSDPQRIGLSATVRPLATVAAFLAGTRPVTIVADASPPRLQVTVTVPMAEMPGISASTDDHTRSRDPRRDRTRPDNRTTEERSVWAAIYPAVLALIRAHQSTIVFVNSRGLCERLAHELNELAVTDGKPTSVRAHHGSVSHSQRAEIEEQLRTGQLAGIVATSSLELGIDMGAVDLVVLVESPGSVARGLQRIGRSGHQVDALSRGYIFPKFPGDLLEAAVIADRMRRGEIESSTVPVNALDVLAQQIVALCLDGERRVADIAQLVTRSWPYRHLQREALDAVLDMLAGKYSFDETPELRPLLVWDRSTDQLRARRGAGMAVRFNAGTIPDRGTFAVYLVGTHSRLGELDEEMVHETRNGDVIALGASTWRVEEIATDRILVSPAPGEPGRLPFWHGDRPGRPLELGMAIGALLRQLSPLSREASTTWLRSELPLDESAARNLQAYVSAQEESGALPTDERIVVERFRDELGDWRVCILSPFGARVHAPWALAIQASLASQAGHATQLQYTDDGLVLRYSEGATPPSAELLFPDPSAIVDLVSGELKHSALFAGLFRENATRSLLLRRRGPQRRTPLWAQRIRSQHLLAMVQKYPDFPVVLETYRQVLGDTFDLPGLREVLTKVRQGSIELVEIETRAASPFARSLVFSYVAANLYNQDAPLAERRATAAGLDHSLLVDLLGASALRSVIDADVLQEVELDLQQLSERRRARDADEAHDLLRRLGDLTLSELDERATEPGFADVLLAEKRALVVSIAGESRVIALEDRPVFDEQSAEALVTLVRRYARTHGPFPARQMAERYGLSIPLLERVLASLALDGVLTSGEMRSGRLEIDWCDSEVLRVLRRRSLAKFKRQVKPVSGATLARFLAARHGIGQQRSGAQALLEVIGQLQGIPLSFRTLVNNLLPARIAGFNLDILDGLSAAGTLVWVGAGALSVNDGRIALYLREHLQSLLLPPELVGEDSVAKGSFGVDAGLTLHDAILAALQARGAIFLTVLADLVAVSAPEVTSDELHRALWDLVWAGQITNDTFGPLRSLGRQPGGRAGGRSNRRPRGRPAERPLMGERRTTGRYIAGGGSLGASALAGGRWSLVGGLTDAGVDETHRSLARAQMLLDRYGVVSRDHVELENVPGGFGPLYQIFKTLEDAGRVRRGNFVEGLTGAQFATIDTVDRLRQARDDRQVDSDSDLLWLSANDPAQIYGGVLPWPQADRDDTTGETESRPRRVWGAWVLSTDGRALLYASGNGRQLTTLGDLTDEHLRRAVFRSLVRLPRATGNYRGRVVVEKINGVQVADSPLRDALLEAGFSQDYRGLSARAG